MQPTQKASRLICDVGDDCAVANAALPLRYHVPVDSDTVVANQAIGHRCYLLAWPPARKLRATGERRIGSDLKQR